MQVARVLVGASRSAIAHGKSCSVAGSPASSSVPLFSNRLRSLSVSTNEASVLQRLLHSASTFQRFGISTSASNEADEKKEQGTGVEDREDNSSSKNEGTEGVSSDKKPDSDSEGDVDELSKDDLVKLVTEKKVLLETREREIAVMKDKVLRSYAEMENVMDRTRRESENSKKFAIQNFAKNLLDVADNLGRASSVVKESFAKIDVSQDAAGAVPLLKTLLEGVEMTEKQLNEVFRKFGVEKYDPTNEQFDPNRHNAVFQVPDNSKPEGTVAAVLKSGYTLHERVIRPAEVGVTKADEDSEANEAS